MLRCQEGAIVQNQRCKAVAPIFDFRFRMSFEMRRAANYGCRFRGLSHALHAPPFTGIRAMAKMNRFRHPQVPEGGLAKIKQNRYSV